MIIVHLPNGDTMNVDMDFEEFTQQLEDNDVKTVDAWQKDGVDHFEIADKTSEDFNQEDEEL